MVYSFQQLLITMSPAFKTVERLDTYEILDYLNRTVDRYIKTKYLSGGSFINNTNTINANIGDLSKLVIATSKTYAFTQVVNMNNVYETDLPIDFLAYVRSDSKITRTVVFTGTDIWVPNNEVDFNQIDQFITTAFNIPILEKPLVSIQNFEGDGSKEVLLIIDGFTTLTNYVLTYIKKPTAIDISSNNCELADYLHEEIVRLAVVSYIDEYKTKLTQSKSKDNE